MARTRCPLPLGGLPVLVIPCMRVDDISTVSGIAVVGAPGPTTLVGFAHALQRHIGGPSIHGIAILMHSFSMHDGFAKMPVDTKKGAAEGAGAAPIIEDPHGRMVCSLLLAIDCKRSELSGIAERATRMMPRMRLAGGVIVEAGLPRRGEDTRGPAVVPCGDEAALADAVLALPPGSFLRDRTDLLPEPGAGDALDALLDAVGVHSEDAGKHWARKQKGWVVPLQRGYRAISPNAMRSGMRTGDGVNGHVWAEEVLGLGEWVPRSRAWGEQLSGVFWTHTADPDCGLYLAVAA